MDQDDSSKATDDTSDKSLPYLNQEAEQSSSQDPILVETEKVVEQADDLTKDDNDIEADSKEALDEPELGLEQEVEEEQEHSVQEPSEPSQDMDSRASTEEQPQEDQESQEGPQSLEEEPHDDNYSDEEPDMNEDDDQYQSRETEGEEEEVDEQGQFPSQSEIPDYDLDQDDPDYESHSQDKGIVASSTRSRRTSSRFVKAVICNENEQVGVVAGVAGSVEVEEPDTRNEAVENEQEKEKENLNESLKSSTDLAPTNTIPTPPRKHSQKAPPIQLSVNNTIITPTPIRARTPTTPRSSSSSSSSPTHNLHFGPKSDAAPSTQRTTKSQPMMKKRKNLNQTKKKKLQILSDIELSDSDDETPANQSLSIISQQIIKDISKEKKASKPLRIGQSMKRKEEHDKLEEKSKVKVPPVKLEYHQFRRPISPPRVSLKPVVFSLDSEPDDEDELSHVN
ncbi:hypothetical protein WICPIJ_000657 [Wickerhamomyces pijperi]|uniref:Uncharacterized protein n=1 Tax=Wickerhamomyces pijperi TaxID=599730 RepID=A0A9P8QFY6_WICPI|nr:hypothetical protein WICPIJ_000657 [Wickerhamomyces pijperi]